MKKQKELPGMERKTIKEVDDAAEHYVDVRDERMALTEKETAAKDALIDVMKRNKLKVYKNDSTVPALTVILTEGDFNVKVQKAKDGESENAAVPPKVRKRKGSQEADKVEAPSAA